MEEKKEVKEEIKEKEYHDEITDKKEIEALEQFKHSIATITDKKDKMVLDPFVLLDNDFLIRFLRARKLNIKKATRMLLDYYHWKAKMNLDYLYSNYVFKEKYKLQLLFPHCFHKVTKDGKPIYIEIMGKLNPDELFKLSSMEEITKYSVQIYEKLERDYFKACSQLKGSYIHSVCNIIDFGGINSSILNKKLLAYVQETFKICQDYYPESLSESYILNANLLFRSFYSAVKIFLDAKTRNKIKVFGSNYKESLLDKIDAENLPKFFGGLCECPEGCLFSNAGPWKKQNEIEENIPEDILKKRKEIIDSLSLGKLPNEETIKNNGKKGINPDDL
jgi:hypothetical protein